MSRGNVWRHNAPLPRLVAGLQVPQLVRPLAVRRHRALGPVHGPAHARAPARYHRLVRAVELEGLVVDVLVAVPGPAAAAGAGAGRAAHRLPVLVLDLDDGDDRDDQDDQGRDDARQDAQEWGEPQRHRGL